MELSKLLCIKIIKYWQKTNIKISNRLKNCGKMLFLIKIYELIY